MRLTLIFWMVFTVAAFSLLLVAVKSITIDTFYISLVIAFCSFCVAVQMKEWR